MSSRGVSDDNDIICLNVVKKLNKRNYLAKLRGHQPTWTYQQPLENGNAITDTILFLFGVQAKPFIGLLPIFYGTRFLQLSL